MAIYRHLPALPQWSVNAAQMERRRPIGLSALTRKADALDWFLRTKNFKRITNRRSQQTSITRSLVEPDQIQVGPATHKAFGFRPALAGRVIPLRLASVLPTWPAWLKSSHPDCGAPRIERDQSLRVQDDSGNKGRILRQWRRRARPQSTRTTPSSWPGELAEILCLDFLQLF